MKLGVHTILQRLNGNPVSGIIQICQQYHENSNIHQNGKSWAPFLRQVLRLLIDDGKCLCHFGSRQDSATRCGNDATELSIGMDHLPYNPDLATSDFPKLKEFRELENDELLKEIFVTG